MSKIVLHNVFEPWPLEDKSVQVIITSPPYFNLRKYRIPDIIIGGSKDCKHSFTPIKVGNLRFRGNERSIGYNRNPDVYALGDGIANICSNCNAFMGQYGLEPVAFGKQYGFVEHTMLWLRESWRVLKDDGIIFIVIGDKYSETNASGARRKSLLMIPERIAIEMQKEGWIIRGNIVWMRTMPEAAKDRFALKRQTIIFATKSSSYYFNLDAVAVPLKDSTLKRYTYARKEYKYQHSEEIEKPKLSLESMKKAAKKALSGKVKGANPGDVWLDYYLEAHKQVIEELGVKGYIEALKDEILSNSDIFPYFYGGLLKDNHYAPFSVKLIQRLMLCSTKVGDTVLDPFCGSGTTVLVAERLNRIGIGFDLGYGDIQKKRLKGIQIELPFV